MLRDKFAMAALYGACASRAGSTNLTYEERAEFAYKQADAMMKERANWADELVAEKLAEMELPPEIWDDAVTRYGDKPEL